MYKFIFWALEVLAEKIGDYKEKCRLEKIKPTAQSSMHEAPLGCEYLVFEVEDENKRIPG